MNSSLRDGSVRCRLLWQLGRLWPLFARAESMTTTRASKGAVTGFSLIELLVAITIGGVLLSIAWVRMSTLVPIYRLEGAARNLAAEIQKARGRAIAENKCFIVTIDTSAKTYQLQNKTAATLPCG